MTRVPGKSYVVGGAVRDRLLGLPAGDRDHVVVGTTADEMIAAGFRPVGRDFPVFLHPTTHEEYALARTERKVAPGYAGFLFHADPAVTLEQDLQRRDLTINAMATDDDSGAVVDPFGGARDLSARLFRHVGPAFVEDPVRILRVARFAARFVDFDVAPDTLVLMRTMVAGGEVDALVAERVWQELARGLMERRPMRMLDVLRACGALGRLLPELEALEAVARGATDDALERAAIGDAPLDVRFALLLHRVGDDAGAAIRAVAARFAVPRDERDLAAVVRQERAALIDAVAALDAARVVDAMERCDAFRRAARFGRVIDAAAATLVDDALRDAFARGAGAALDASTRVDAGAIARAAGGEVVTIRARLRAARIDAVGTVWQNRG